MYADYNIRRAVLRGDAKRTQNVCACIYVHDDMNYKAIKMGFKNKILKILGTKLLIENHLHLHFLERYTNDFKMIYYFFLIYKSSLGIIIVNSTKQLLVNLICIL